MSNVVTKINPDVWQDVRDRVSTAIFNEEVKAKEIDGESGDTAGTD